MAEKDFAERTAALDALLGVGRCFDMTGRDLTVGGCAARLWVVNGYAQEDVLERIIAAWQALSTLRDAPDAESFCRRYVSACDAAVEYDRDRAVMGVFAGKTLTLEDDRFDYGETRYQTYGLLGERVVMVVWTPRGDARHIISMRHCHDKETRKVRERLGGSG